MAFGYAKVKYIHIFFIFWEYAQFPGFASQNNHFENQISHLL